MTSERLASTLDAIIDANRQDPNTEIDDQGQPQPKEVLYSSRMSEMLHDFINGPSEALQIAACAQHIERWKSPRADYPEGRAGYKKWRAELGLFHARRAGEIMALHGYDEKTIEQTQYLLQKRQLKRNPETQTLEDVICLVFLKYYLQDFAAKHAKEKLIDIIQKTWHKMSEDGHQAALRLPLSEPMLELVKKALSTN